MPLEIRGPARELRAPVSMVTPVASAALAAERIYYCSTPAGLILVQYSSTSIIQYNTITSIFESHFFCVA